MNNVVDFDGEPDVDSKKKISDRKLVKGRIRTKCERALKLIFTEQLLHLCFTVRLRDVRLRKQNTVCGEKFARGVKVRARTDSINNQYVRDDINICKICEQ